MTDVTAPAPALREDDRMLAAEHALGVSEGAARARAERLFERDPAFRRAVEDWQAQLEPLLDEVAAETPPARVWRAVEAEIGRADAHAAPARRPAGERVREAVAPVMAPWRALALMALGGALAAFTLVTLIDRDLVRVGAPPAPVLVASLGADGGGALARLEGRDGLVVRIAALGTGEGEAAEAVTVPQLWLIPADGTPRSLGLPGADGAVALPAGIAPAPGETLAVSLEPPGGSPTGSPTGPVVATGTLVEI